MRFQNGHTPWNKGIKNSYTPWNKGKTGVYSDQTREQMSDSAKGRIPWNKGKTGVYSLETLAKFSAVHKGKKLSPSHKKALHDSNSGKTHWLYGGHHSEATKQKMSNTHTGTHSSDKTKKKLSELHEHHDHATCMCLGCRNRRGDITPGYWKGKHFSRSHLMKMAFAHCETIEGMIRVSIKFHDNGGGLTLPQSAIDELYERQLEARYKQVVEKRFKRRRIKINRQSVDF